MSQINENHKLYIITRKDLSTAAIAVQSSHAIAEFIIQYPAEANQWHKISNSICILEAENIQEIEKIIDAAINKNIKISIFREPDFNNEITSIALEPGSKTKKFCFKFKLALRDS